MTGYTPIYNLPYVEASDLVANYPTVSEELAENIETALGSLGGIVQVVSTTIGAQFTTTSTGFVDITGFSLSITPTANTSKVFVIVTIGLGGNTSGTHLSLYNLYRDSTAIAQPSGGTAMTAGLYSNNGVTGHATAFSFLDSPATTSATTYKVAMRVNGGTGVINRLALNTDWQSVSTITAMEVAA